MASAFEVARDLIDQAHKRDPLYVSPSPSGGASKQHELAYAHAMEAWVRKLLPGLKGSQAFIELQQQVQTDDQGLEQLLILAARCQHLERFLTPRSSFPDGKAGYLKWRRQLYTTQADRAVQLLTQAGLDEKQADYVHKWVSKTDLKPGKNDGDLGTQLLEDAAVLVFLQDELALFASQHEEYTEQKWIDIIKKTWRKLSPLGKEEAKKLSMADGLSQLMEKAVQIAEEGSKQGDSAETIGSKKQVSSAAPYMQRALRPKTAAEAEAMLAAQKEGDETKFFGARLLKDEEGVWAHNAWDHVQPPEEHLAMVEELLAKQAETKLTLEEAETYHDKPASYWDTFYSAHENRFFKDRKWLHLEFPELVEATLENAGPTTILEVGCGAGNTVFPLLEINKNPQLTIHACDYSSEAVNVVRSNGLYANPPGGATCHANVWDLSGTSSAADADGDGGPSAPPGIQAGSVDIVVLIFVFSALHPREWAQAVRNVRHLLKPETGLVLLRDYGRHDLPQLRFRKRRMLDDNFYLRGDGTRVYFFTPEDLIDIFNATPAPPERDADQLLPKPEPDAGAESQPSQQDTDAANKTFRTEQMAIDRRLLVNRKEKKRMYRVWMQAKFRIL